MSERIFKDANYRVTAYRAEGGEGKAFVISFSQFTESHDPLEARAFKADFGADAIVAAGLNCVAFTTNRNDWYQAASASDAIAAINAFIPKGSRVITYGTSMGGFAAINFSEQLAADYFLAFSPQATMRSRFFRRIGDGRWQRERSVLALNQDFIVEGDVKNRKGVIVYDDKTASDAGHALACSQLTAGQLIPITASGHRSARAANRYYGLKKMLAEIAADTFDVSAAAALISSRNSRTLDFLAADGEKIDAFAERLLHNPEDLTLQTITVLVRSLQERKSPVSWIDLAYCSALLKAGEPLFADKKARYEVLQKIVDAEVTRLLGRQV